MAHRTLNPRTAFGLDAREISSFTEDTRKYKKEHINDIWRQEFGDEPKPRYTAYQRLMAAGWKFSSRYGWRKTVNAPA